MPSQGVRASNDDGGIALSSTEGYHDMMKRSMLKLVTRRETVRMLTELDLRRADGGYLDAQLMDTGGGLNAGCVAAQAALLPKS